MGLQGKKTPLPAKKRKGLNVCSPRMREGALGKGTKDSQTKLKCRQARNPLKQGRSQEAVELRDGFLIKGVIGFCAHPLSSRRGLLRETWNTSAARRGRSSLQAWSRSKEVLELSGKLLARCIQHGRGVGYWLQSGEKEKGGGSIILIKRLRKHKKKK